MAFLIAYINLKIENNFSDNEREIINQNNY